MMRFKLVELVHHLHAMNQRDPSRHCAGDVDCLAHLRFAHAHFVQLLSFISILSFPDFKNMNLRFEK